MCIATKFYNDAHWCFCRFHLGFVLCFDKLAEICFCPRWNRFIEEWNQRKKNDGIPQIYWTEYEARAGIVQCWQIRLRIWTFTERTDAMPSARRPSEKPLFNSIQCCARVCRYAECNPPPKNEASAKALTAMHQITQNSQSYIRYIRETILYVNRLKTTLTSLWYGCELNKIGAFQNRSWNEVLPHLTEVNCADYTIVMNNFLLQLCYTCFCSSADWQKLDNEVGLEPAIALS